MLLLLGRQVDPPALRGHRRAVPDVGQGKADRGRQQPLGLGVAVLLRHPLELADLYHGLGLEPLEGLAVGVVGQLGHAVGVGRAVGRRRARQLPEPALLAKNERGAGVPGGVDRLEARCFVDDDHLDVVARGQRRGKAVELDPLLVRAPGIHLAPDVRADLQAVGVDDVAVDVLFQLLRPLVAVADQQGIGAAGKEVAEDGCRPDRVDQGQGGDDQRAEGAGRVLLHQEVHRPEGGQRLHCSGVAQIKAARVQRLEVGIYFLVRQRRLAGLDREVVVLHRRRGRPVIPRQHLEIGEGVGDGKVGAVQGFQVGDVLREDAGLAGVDDEVSLGV